MSDFRTALAQLRRPRLLMQAVRHCLAEDRRPRAPQAIFDELAAPDDGSMSPRMTSLMRAEARIEAARLAGDAVYSPQSHIAVLAALIFEARRSGQPA